MKLSGRRVITSVVVILLIGCFVVFWLGCRVNEPMGNVDRDVFGRAEVRRAFAKAEVASVQRLHRSPEGARPRELASYDPGPLRAVPATTVHEMQQLFQDPRSFSWELSKSCAPEHGVLFTFSAPSENVQIALCFECAIFSVFVNGSSVGSEEDFERIRPQLLRITKALFPDDQELQAIQ